MVSYLIGYPTVCYVACRRRRVQNTITKAVYRPAEKKRKEAVVDTVWWVYYQSVVVYGMFLGVDSQAGISSTSVTSLAQRCAVGVLRPAGWTPAWSPSHLRRASRRRPQRAPGCPTPRRRKCDLIRRKPGCRRPGGCHCAGTHL